MKNRYPLNIVAAIAALTIGVAHANAGVVAYWSFDGDTVPSRLQADVGSPSLDATEVSGSSAWNTRAGFGEVLANGLNPPYLSVADNNAIDFGTTSFSASIWTYRTSDTGAQVKGIFDHYGTTNGYQALYLEDNKIRLAMRGSSALTVDTTASHLTLNAWQNIVFTVDRTLNVAKIYVNGVEATPSGGVSIAGLGNIAAGQDLWISTLNTTAPSRARLDDFALFNHVLTAQQIAAINANGGQTIASVFPVPTPAALPAGIAMLGLAIARRRR